MEVLIKQVQKVLHKIYPSRRYYSDSIISVNSGKDELYGILTSDGLTSEHSTKDNTNPLIQNYYTGWTIELKNENVSPYYVKTIVYTSTSTNGVGTTITLKDTTPLLTGGSKYILTPPSITGCLLHVNNDSNGDPIFKLEPPYSTISNFYQGWTIKCGNKISVIDTDSTIGSLNSGQLWDLKIHLVFINGIVQMIMKNTLKTYSIMIIKYLLEHLRVLVEL